MALLNYTCKFCGSPGTAEYADDCPPLKLDIWKSWLCCNRCADFEEHRRAIGRKITRVCTVAISVRRWMDGLDLKAKERDLLKHLTPLTRDYSRLLAEFYRKPELWDDQFPEWLMEKPEQSWKILGTFRANFVKMV